MKTHSVVGRGATLAVALFGCSMQRGAAVGSPAATQAAEVACTATTGKLPTGTSVTALSGRYRLTLVATSGPRAGKRMSGTLKLDPPPRSANPVMTLPGSSVIALDSVGATAPGSRTASDVTALQWATSQNGVMTPQITVRFGSITPPGNTKVIEGAHMALFVNTITGDGFFGTWDSGAGDTPMNGAAGHFCARHVK